MIDWVAFFITIWIISVAFLIFKLFKLFKARKRSRPEWVEGFSGRRVKDTEGGKLYAKLAKGKCPDCGHAGFFQGPSGGLSTNIFCANPKCKSGFNVTPYIGTAERIGKCQWRYDDEEGQ